MCRLSYLGFLVCLVTVVAWHRSAAGEQMPRPDDGTVMMGIYTNDYFHLSYPLPPGWTEGIAGPGPSETGYYVLGTFIPVGEFTGTIMITAQDKFFAVKPLDDAATMALDFSRSTAEIEGMTIDRPPSEVEIAGRRFSRVDFSGVGLFRSALITEIRCHLVSINLTAKSPALLAALAASVKNLGFRGDRDAGTDPMCIGNYADARDLLARADPAAIGPTSTPIPVRIVIGTDGSVKHVNVIRAIGSQRDSIANALGQWKFKPRETESRTAEIETGLLIEFMPAGSIRYSTENRPNSPG
jgi:hypothetical protein